ncbi:MAG: ATP-dependent zinc metalloprotease FtsH [Planctomycetes bacterium]|nr:ATP-dependent zinc metalloprotease FtsH [Planctomycetota bacterium]
MPESDGNESKKPDPKKPTPPNMKMPSRGVATWMVFLALSLLLVVVFAKGFDSPQQITINEFRKFLDDDAIEKLTVKENRIIGVLKPSERYPATGTRKFEMLYLPQAMDSRWMDRIEKKVPDAEFSVAPRSYWVEFLIAMLPWLFIFLFIYLFVFRQIRAAGGGGGMLGNFGRSRHRVTSKEHVKVSFGDVAGITEAKEEVQELIEFLRNPKRFQRLGGRIPRGVLLVGPPGCGKTLLAKAIAGEADVPFFSISGSDFVEMFVGVGASRVRDLFKQAKDNSPCIIFLDEIDAVGRRRGGNFGGGGHDEREQTLNAILVEMDGFDTSDQVIVIAATNRVDVLDPALVRPGRFDREVNVSLPDVQGRYEILKVHARKVRLGPNVDMRRLARATPMFSGAELAAIINESAIIATMGNKDYIEMDDLEEARDKVRWGRARRSRQVDEHDKKVTAYHEAGHAIVQVKLKDADPLHKVSILSRGPYGGATFSLPERDRMVYTQEYLVAMIQVAFGGRIAEDMFFGEISSGASMDIKQVTAIARQMVKEYGMNESLGFVFYGDEEGEFGMGRRPYSDSTADRIDQEVKKLVDKLYEQTAQLMSTNRDVLAAIAEALLKYETLTGDDVHAIVRGETLNRPTISDILDAEQTNSGSPVGKARPAESESDAGIDLGGGSLPAPG